MLLGAVMVPLLGFVACTAIVGTAVTAVDQQAKTVRNVTYQVETSGRPATVMYDTSTPDGVSTATATGVKSGWSIQVRQAGILGPNMTASLDPTMSVKQRGGTVTCRILVDGQLVKEASAAGEYASVSCFAPGTTR
ncbi:MAG: hypothetical protein M3N43_11180 [Actinomycetota bacterium]|nr:hypothetical protein [Actinomycetota bacterium]